MKNVETKRKPEAEPVINEATVRPAHETGDDKVKEINGPQGLEPTRFGDWERKGRCVDF